MSSKRLLFVLSVVAGIFLAAGGLRGAESGLEFTGYVRDEKGLSLALRNTASGDSKWVAIGQEFEDYKVVRLDEKTEILVLTKGGAEFRLPLVQAKIKQVAMEIPPEMKRKIMNNLRQLAAASDQYYLENGVSRATFDDLVGTTKYVKRVEPVDGEDYKSLQFVQGKKLQVQTNQGYIVSYLP
jgi:hypothetical protein